MSNPSIYRNKQPKGAGFIIIRRKRDEGGNRKSAFPRKMKGDVAKITPFSLPQICLRVF